MKLIGVGASVLVMGMLLFVGSILGAGSDREGSFLFLSIALMGAGVFILWAALSQEDKKKG